MECRSISSFPPCPRSYSLTDLRRQVHGDAREDGTPCSAASASLSDGSAGVAQEGRQLGAHRLPHGTLAAHERVERRGAGQPLASGYNAVERPPLQAPRGPRPAADRHPDAGVLPRSTENAVREFWIEKSLSGEASHDDADILMGLFEDRASCHWRSEARGLTLSLCFLLVYLSLDIFPQIRRNAAGWESQRPTLPAPTWGARSGHWLEASSLHHRHFGRERGLRRGGRGERGLRGRAEAL